MKVAHLFICWSYMKNHECGFEFCVMPRHWKLQIIEWHLRILDITLIYMVSMVWCCYNPFNSFEKRHNIHSHCFDILEKDDQASVGLYLSVRVFLAATKQLYEWYFLSVCPSVCPSVRLSVCPSVRLSVCPSVTPFWLCSHHRIIMKFSGVITLDQGKVHAKGQGQRSKVKVTEVTTQIFVSGL